MEPFHFLYQLALSLLGMNQKTTKEKAAPGNGTCGTMYPAAEENKQQILK